VRDFRIVDQHQSNGVDTTYLLIDKTVLAQNTPARAKECEGAEGKETSWGRQALLAAVVVLVRGLRFVSSVFLVLSNGLTDNVLLNKFISPALGCDVFESSSITSPSGKTASLATNVTIPALTGRLPWGEACMANNLTNSGKTDPSRNYKLNTSPQPTVLPWYP
jgi:hypothetical protein